MAGGCCSADSVLAGTNLGSAIGNTGFGAGTLSLCVCCFGALDLNAIELSPSFRRALIWSKNGAGGGTGGVD